VTKPEVTKPGVIVLSPDDDTSFHWLSDGWFCAEVRNHPEAQAIMARARECVNAGVDVPDVIARLEAAGFVVTRSECVVIVVTRSECVVTRSE